MRITGGRARGIILKIPRHGELRPATDALRQAVFSSLGPVVTGARVLDLFAGTGAYGLEALSRGAAHASWVDLNSHSVTAIRDNLAAVAKSLGATNAASLGHAYGGDIFKWQPPPGTLFDIIFVDPPYAMLPTQGMELLTRASAWLAPGPDARLLLEAPGVHPADAPPGWILARRLGKGARQPGSLIFRREG